jgi:hypothetical protein
VSLRNSNFGYGGDADYPEVTLDPPADVQAEVVISPDLFAAWLEAIVVYDEAPFEFDEDGIHVGVVNGEKSLQVETTLFREAFWQFDHYADRSVERCTAIAPVRETAGIADLDADERVKITVSRFGVFSVFVVTPLTDVVSTAARSTTSMISSESRPEPSIPSIGISSNTSRARDLNWAFEMNSSGSVRTSLSFGRFTSHKSGQRMNQ